MRAKPLSPRQLYALKARAVFVLRGEFYTAYKTFTIAEIAAVLKCGKERVRQLEGRGRRNFKKEGP